MSEDAAKAEAVEAAALAYLAVTQRAVPLPAIRAAIDAYLSHIAAAGWVMVRDAGIRGSGLHRGRNNRASGYDDGWNACRAAMLGRE